MKSFSDLCDTVRTGQQRIQRLGTMGHPAIRAITDTGVDPK